MSLICQMEPSGDPPTNDSRAHDWGVLHRILAEDGGEQRILKLRIRDVPPGAGKKEIKAALERAGRIFGEGSVLWGNHVVLPRDEWLDQDGAAAETLTYTDLLDEARGEKRVTLRLPIGLHAQLVKAAQGKSFNQFVTDTLSSAIDYAEESIEPALPRIAAKQGITEAELREKMAKSVAARKEEPEAFAAFAARFGEHLARKATLPPEQIKAQHEAFTTSPQFAEARAFLRSGSSLANLTDEQIAAAAEKLGFTPEQFRERMNQVQEKTKDYDWDVLDQQMREQSPQDYLDNTLMLRDIFTGRAASLASPPEESIEEEQTEPL